MTERASLKDIVAHKFIETNGNRMHYVEMGSGPTVLLMHGFPDFWYGFRYQIPALAAAGFHVVAPDLRGFGESGMPVSVDKYTAIHHAGDMIALLDALQVKQALVVGHDWGSVYAADLCLMRPDRVKAVVFLSVPFSPIDPKVTILEKGHQIFGDRFYMFVFQKPGQAEELFGKSTSANVLKGFYLRWHLCTKLEVPKFCTDEDDEVLPEWFNEKDVKYYSETFDRTGFTGGFNHYRVIETNREVRATLAFANIYTPCMTVLAKRDLPFIWPGRAGFLKAEVMKKFLPNQQKLVILEDAGHFLHQEKHEDVNELLLGFLQQFKE